VLKDSKLKRVRNVCKSIGNSFKNGRKLDILVHAEGLLYDSKQWELIERPPLSPTLSLEDALDVGAGCFTPGDKIILAANLARALLRMYSSDMAIQEITAKDIYFLFNPTDGMVFEGHNPYLTCSLVLPRDHEKGDVEGPEKHYDPFEVEKRKDSSGPIKLPMLVSFGELLMEIALGRKMGPYDCRADIALLAEIDPKHYTGQIVKMVGKPYVDVIIQCLKTSQIDVFDSDSDSDSDSDTDVDAASDSGRDYRGDTRNLRNPNGQDSVEVRKKKKETEEKLCRATILAAVASLDKARTTFAPKTDIKPPFQFKIKKTTQARPTATRAWGPIATADQQGTGGKPLDDVRLNVDPTDPRCVLINTPLCILCATLIPGQHD
jgi:hypothetical protein